MTNGFHPFPSVRQNCQFCRKQSERGGGEQRKGEETGDRRDSTVDKKCTKRKEMGRKATIKCLLCKEYIESRKDSEDKDRRMRREETRPK